MRNLLVLLVRVALVLFWVVLMPNAGFAAGNAAPTTQSPEMKSALFAGGSFWVLEQAFKNIPGIHNSVVGYSGGKTPRPNYVDVSHGGTGHRETLQVTYDPSKISYERLLAIYWRNIDPFDTDGQFCDTGEIYRTAIYVRGDEQKKAAEESKEKLEKRFGKKIATEILPASIFYPAEEYHQDYADEHEFQYSLYHDTCGQEKGLKQIWGQEAGGNAYRKAQ